MAEIITCRNIGGMKIKEKLKAKFEGAIRNARIPGTQSQLEKLNFARCRLIFSTQFLSLFSLHTKIRISLHAPSIKRQMAVRFTDHSRILGPQNDLDLCQHSSTKSLEVAPRFLGNLCNTGPK